MKPSKQAQNKWLKGSFNEDGNLFTVPEVIAKDIQSRGWVHRWLNNRKLKDNGGYDERGYIAYRIPENLRKVIKPGEYGEDYEMSIDGCLHRGDMVLGIMPKEKRDKLVAKKNAANAMSRERLSSAIDDRSKGRVSSEEVTFENVTIKPQSILED